MPRKKKEEIIEEVVEEVDEEFEDEEYADDEEYEDINDEDYDEQEDEEYEEDDEYEDDEEFGEDVDIDDEEFDYDAEDDIAEEDLDNFDEDIASIDDIEDEDYDDGISDIVGGLSGVGDTGELEGASTASSGDTISTAEFYEKLEKLAEIGKEKDVLEYHDIEEFFKDDNIDSNLLEAAIDYLASKHIAVLREDESDEDLTLDENDAKEALELTVAEGVSTEDPVRMYLKDIGQVQLLTAEEERDLAMKMERRSKGASEEASRGHK